MGLSELANGWAFWLVMAAVAVGVCLLVVWRVLIRRADLVIQRRSRMFSVAERNFFECLSNALHDDYHIFTKVMAADVTEPSPAANAVQKIAFKAHYAGEVLDFVLCKKQDMSIFGVIELENFEKHGNAKRRESRESAISSLCKSANLRLFYFDVRQDYKGVDIRRLITGRGHSGSEKMSGTHQSQLTLDGASISDFSKVRSCPKCHSEVVTKVAVKGAHIGEKFLM